MIPKDRRLGCFVRANKSQFVQFELYLMYTFIGVHAKSKSPSFPRDYKMRAWFILALPANLIAFFPKWNQ